MTDGTELRPACNICCFWAPNLRGEAAQEGVCRKLAENPRYYGSLVTEETDSCDQWARLGIYEDPDGQTKPERRSALRTRINLPARLHTVRGDQAVWLADISEHGAGISTSNPPLVGMPGVLKWSSYEVFVTVAWASDDSCGVQFDAPVSGEIVLEAIREGALKNDRWAKPSRIVQGHKRARLHHGLD
ncbi:PilZ domain-containing protein [Tsuneonella mangrovi]|uniref:PilZ domain-containing protein n=1 Tax=Tsuneonella mangrovi TaxID=1982042 RepID=UPI000BA2A929